MRGIEDPVLKAPPLAVSGKETEPKLASIWPLLEWRSKWEILETSPRGDRDRKWGWKLLLLFHLHSTVVFFTCYMKLLLNSKICEQPPELLIEKLKRVRTPSQSASNKTTLGLAFYQDSLYNARHSTSAERHRENRKHLAISRLVLMVQK